MPEDNRMDRLDRIQQHLNTSSASHLSCIDSWIARLEAKRVEHEEWRRQREVEQEIYRREQYERDKALDERIDRAVADIRELIATIQAKRLSSTS